MTVSETKTEVTIRTFQEGDIPALVDVINRAMEAYNIPDRLEEDVIRFQLQIPFINAAEDFFTAVDADNQIVGASFNVLQPRTGRASGNIAALPEYNHIKRQLLETGDRRIEAKADQLIQDDRPVYIIRQAFKTQTDEIELLESCGYSVTRDFYEMHIDFDGPIEAPVFPAGVEIRPFDQEKHARVVHQAQQEAFRDHWGHAEDAPFDEWIKRFEHPHYDPSSYYIAWDGDQVAGISFCNVDAADPQSGWVDILGVRRPWRKQGLGLALLRYSFYQFQQRGMTKAGLGVDASSKTNAVALYERGGMHVRNQISAYRKVLRGNPADIVE